MPSPPASIMVCTGVLTGLLLFSLSSSVVSADRVDLKTLHRIIQVFEARYKPGEDLQYAVAINVPAEQCKENFNENFNNNFLISENTNNVKNDLKNKKLYEGIQMVAATPKGSGSTAIHSERALLMCEDNNQADAPMETLLSKGDGNDCVVFYTYNSPCLDHCLNQAKDKQRQDFVNRQIAKGKTDVPPAVKKCILDSLSILTNHPGPKAFVYSQVYRMDKPELDNKKTELLASALTQVAEKVPLYKCNATSCIECLDNNNNFNEECLS